MLSLCAFILTFILSVKYKKMGTVLSYYFLSLVMIYLLALNGVEAAFQIAPKPSDSYLYYGTFNLDFIEIGSQIFHEYPLFLKSVIYPFDSPYLAIFSQSIFLCLSVLLAFKKAPYINYAIILLSHCVIYTTSNFLKDNLILIGVFFTVFLINEFKGVFIRVLIIALSLYLMSSIRPFLLLFMPLSFAPVFSVNLSKKVKVMFAVLALIGFAFVIYFNWGLINYVATKWSSDHSVGTSGMSILAPVKIFLGPTPLHYAKFEDYFIQPILASHAYLLTVLHVFYYLLISLLFVMFVVNLRKMPRIYFNDVSSIYLFGIGFGLMLVYIIAYGTADIRQRALIHSFIFSSFLINKDVRFDKYVPSVVISFVLLFLLIFVVTLLLG